MSDQHGYTTNSVEDCKRIARELTLNGSIIFEWSPDQKTLHTIFLCEKFVVLGPQHQFGQAKGKCLVSIVGCSRSFWFDLNFDADLHPDYVAEKLELSRDSDTTKDLAVLLSNVRRNRK